MPGTTDPATWIVALLQATGSAENGKRHQCPAHPDPTPSLSVRLMPDGKAAVKCFAGCTTGDILRALRIPRAALRTGLPWAPESHPGRVALSVTYPPLSIPDRAGRTSSAGWHLEAVHPYGAAWQLVRYRHTSGAKDLVWETQDARGAWIPGLRGALTSELPLYFEGEVHMAVALGDPVHVVESESSADAFMARGLYATTWAGGASSPPLTRLARVLAGAHVVLIPDNDEPGIRCATAIETAIETVAASLSIVWPDPGHDARDLLAHHPDKIRSTP